MKVSNFTGGYTVHYYHSIKLHMLYSIEYIRQLTH